jgi:hypothetical protein
MPLVLPVTGTVLKFKHGAIRALNDELAAADREIGDLLKDPWLTATRFIQIGRAWQEAITLEDADAIIDAEVEGGVLFNDLHAALLNAFRGKRGRRLKVQPPDADEDDDEPADDDAGEDAADAAPAAAEPDAAPAKKKRAASVVQ